MFVDCLRSRQHASVNQGRICSDNWPCCHTEIEVADQTYSIPTPGQPVPAHTLHHQAPGRVVTGTPIFKTLIWPDPGKSLRGKRESNPGLLLSRWTP